MAVGDDLPGTQVAKSMGFKENEIAPDPESGSTKESNIRASYQAPKGALERGYNNVNSPQSYGSDSANPTERMNQMKSNASDAKARYMKENHVDENGDPTP